MRVLARCGFVMLGLVHIIIGAIAISVATHAGGGEADQSGAMSQIARTGGGIVLLWVMAIALAALTVWQIAQVILVREREVPKRWAKRASEAGKGIAYAVLAVLAVIFAFGGRASSHRTSETTSQHLLATPGGVFVVAAIGLVVFSIGAGFVFLGVRGSFRKQLRMPSGAIGRAITVVGVVGYVAKGVALDVVGVLFVIAAVTGDAQKAGGLDSALRSLRHLAFGELLLWIVGCGLIVYGVYCGIRAVRARL